MQEVWKEGFDGAACVPKLVFLRWFGRPDFDVAFKVWKSHQNQRTDTTRLTTRKGSWSDQIKLQFQPILKETVFEWGGSGWEWGETKKIIEKRTCNGHIHWYLQFTQFQLGFI